MIDEAIVRLKAGRGGDGAVTFRREKFVPFGGPDGGDGGRGGSIIIKANPSTHGLASYRGQKLFKAEAGESGSGTRSSGKSGSDLILSVPLGTEVKQLFQETGQVLNIIDLINEDQQIVICQGGHGGKGNWHFRSSTNQAPREHTLGTPGEERIIKLELKLLAEVGLVGLPNAGKSTLLSVISQARPKIGDYPFTTLEPQLGQVDWQGDSFVVADVPGLIQGASQGKGLGHQFLKHLSRVKLLVHLIDATSNDLTNDYQIIRDELNAYSPELASCPEILVITKIDLLPEFAELQAEFIQKYQPLAISAATHAGVDQLLTKIAARLEEHRTE
ncbi:MAG: GTP-binding protein [Candidatus Berkelbacteria bacterium Gr01-1014_85]|uniref:GTPase Obg n=1 Tax=Candidatus Berkelbacteria bacterium Gr01-1014_85 TaxID=2017150 RepID=A0A554J9F3_9BACT|nr:MAG: GTP-binding protein [Candidatus Berkelbacteria bacterium Gr01-1014_85]